MITGAWNVSFHHFLQRENSLYKKLSFPIHYVFLNSLFYSFPENLFYLVVLCLNANSQLSNFQGRSTICRS